MLLVIAEVAPAMVPMDVLFAMEMLPPLKDSREEVTGGGGVSNSRSNSHQFVCWWEVLQKSLQFRGESTDGVKPALPGFISLLIC